MNQATKKDDIVKALMPLLRRRQCLLTIQLLLVVNLQSTKLSESVLGVSIAKMGANMSTKKYTGHSNAVSHLKTCIGKVDLGPVLTLYWNTLAMKQQQTKLCEFNIGKTEPAILPITTKD